MFQFFLSLGDNSDYNNINEFFHGHGQAMEPWYTSSIHLIYLGCQKLRHPIRCK